PRVDTWTVSTAITNSLRGRRGVVAAHDEALVEQRETEADDEDDQGDGGAVAEGEALETVLVHVGCHRLAGVDGTAFGHDPDQIEELERAEGREEDRKADGWTEEWDGDVANGAPVRGAVDEGGFFQFGRDVLQTGEIEDEVETEVFPGDDD